MTRDLSELQAKQRIAAQLSTEERFVGRTTRSGPTGRWTTRSARSWRHSSDWRDRTIHILRPRSSGPVGPTGGSKDPPLPSYLATELPGCSAPRGPQGVHHQHRDRERADATRHRRQRAGDVRIPRGARRRRAPNPSTETTRASRAQPERAARQLPDRSRG